MATIAENLQKIINSKAAIKASINAKGGTVTDSTPLDEYSTAIDNLPSGGGGDNSYAVLATDEEMADAIQFNSLSYTPANYLKEITYPEYYGFVNTTAGSSVLSGQRANFTTLKVSFTNSVHFTGSLGKNAFASCYRLKTIVGDFAPTRIYAYAFHRTFDLESITTLNLSNCSTIDSNAFEFSGFNAWRRDNSKRGSLGDLVLKDSCSITASSFLGANFNSIRANTANLAYSGCLAILGSTVIIGANCTRLRGDSFTYTGYVEELNPTSASLEQIPSTSNVEILRMLGTTPPDLSSAFDSAVTTSLQHIYVPASAVNAYKTATNWSALASIISADPN